MLTFPLKETFLNDKLYIAIERRLLLLYLYFRLHWATCWQLSTKQNAGRNLSKRTENGCKQHSFALKSSIYCISMSQHAQQGGQTNFAQVLR